MDFFAVEHLSVEKLLSDWRWLCPQPLTLVARNAFGDLFLRDEQDRILWLNIAIGRISEVAESFEKWSLKTDRASPVPNLKVLYKTTASGNLFPLVTGVGL